MPPTQPEHPLIAVVGPTASGKTALALKLAQNLEGEIVNADSRQVYRGMDIGAAKPTPEERSLVSHHLFDIRDPDETYSLALFLGDARAAVSDIQSRHRLPILVGGSGQYVWSLLEGWQPPKVAPNPAIRADLEFQLERRGIWPLFELLQAIDPQTAERIDPQNPRRVLRALEIHLSGGRNPGSNHRPQNPDVNALVIGLTMPRETLYARIDRRVDEMMQRGFLDEVRRLLDEGHSPSLPAMSGVGYQELAAHLTGDLALEDAVQRTKYRTHAIARRQYAWFRLEDPRIHWLQSDDTALESALEFTQNYLKTSSPR